jgi:hypothetical protein
MVLDVPERPSMQLSRAGESPQQISLPARLELRLGEQVVLS